MNKELRYCVVCKQMTRCQKEIDRYKDQTTKGNIYYNEKDCDCPYYNGIVFNSPKTTIHLDCLMEMMDKVVDKCT